RCSTRSPTPAPPHGSMPAAEGAPGLADEPAERPGLAQRTGSKLLGPMSQPEPEHASPTRVDEVLENLNPPQREAVEHGEGPLLIFAGAGSGKTRVLTTRIAYLIERRRVFPERLLAVTFTNKAAREMRSRVGWLLEDEERPRNMWVGTFHATAVKLLRREAKTLEIEPSFVIFDEDDTRAALKRVLEDLNLD